ncbi:putative homoserine kinase type II (protein kinase fold) [Desulfosporosinus youngiae DSM 17734]|uniref:Putative homoserine kinase type II (Protein kinase fold) n=1 Tax=Desulfosporosinus youngiae DSM 17734 TaxID=768710 RepID=H5Y5M1_9FIRM|nr:putative homoserine kinase type II (protein kinase fold) [Desulfosporosinus youngiae DSM 17734]
MVAPLGGRLNQHWLVDLRGERLVLRLWWSKSPEDMDYELRLLTSISVLGWPVAPAVEGPVNLDGQFWCLFPYLPGDPPSVADRIAEQRARGRLLAQFHTDLEKLSGFGQRGDWQRCEKVLNDPTLERVLSKNERKQPEETRILRWHLERARQRVDGLKTQARPSIVIHGDFTPWNLLFKDGRLSGILDFEFAHLNHRVADFALSWRGRHDEVVRAYDEVSPLDPEEWELLTPVWWAWLIGGACKDLAQGILTHEWTIKHLLRRSPLMGQDSAEFR